jgi:glycosyltransferase involved in cell wall biosynthesis
MPKLYRDSPFDIIYSHRSAILAPILFKRIHGTPWVYDLQTHPVTQSPRSLSGHPLKRLAASIYDRFKSIVNRLAFRQCDLIVTVSTALKEQLVKQLGAPPEKVFVLPLGVDRGLFKRAHDPSPSPPGTLRMVYASSVALYRGHQTCIEAARILKARGIPFTMEFMGTGEKRNMDILGKLTKNHGLENEVLWRGFIPHRELPEHLSKAHIGLSPLPDIEAYRVSSPTKVFEYMAMGLAIIASDMLAHRDLIEAGKTGLLFRPDDPEDLADKAQALYSNPNRRTEMAKAAMEASKAYDWNVLLEGLDRQIQWITRR